MFYWWSFQFTVPFVSLPSIVTVPLFFYFIQFPFEPINWSFLFPTPFLFAIKSSLAGRADSYHCLFVRFRSASFFRQVLCRVLEWDSSFREENIHLIYCYGDTKSFVRNELVFLVVLFCLILWFYPNNFCFFLKVLQRSIEAALL